MDNTVVVLCPVAAATGFQTRDVTLSRWLQSISTNPVDEAFVGKCWVVGAVGAAVAGQVFALTVCPENNRKS
jgi:hypothetical protein